MLSQSRSFALSQNMSMHISHVVPTNASAVSVVIAQGDVGIAWLVHCVGGFMNLAPFDYSSVD